MNELLNFTDAAIINRFETFVSEFLMDEVNVKREEILPRLWTVSVPDKDFHVMIELKNIGTVHGVEQWCAVVKEPDGEASNFMLFQTEIEEWLSNQRKLRGIE